MSPTCTLRGMRRAIAESTNGSSGPVARSGDRTHAARRVTGAFASEVLGGLQKVARPDEVVLPPNAYASAVVLGPAQEVVRQARVTPPLRIVFLDFDGVLNARALVDRAPLPLVLGGELLDAEAVARVERLCVEAGAAIVVTSTWRLTFDRTALQGLLRAQGLASTPVLDCTPFIPHKRGRGQEIQRWLDAAPPLAGLVILDDEADMLHLAPWLVQTSFETGLLDAHADAALVMLERAPPSAS